MAIINLNNVTSIVQDDDESVLLIHFIETTDYIAIDCSIDTFAKVLEIYHQLTTNK